MRDDSGIPDRRPPPTDPAQLDDLLSRTGPAGGRDHATRALLDAVAAMGPGWAVLQAVGDLGRPARSYILLNERSGIALIDITPGPTHADAPDRVRRLLQVGGVDAACGGLPPVIHLCMPARSLPSLELLLDNAFASQPAPRLAGRAAWVELARRALGPAQVLTSAEPMPRASRQQAAGQPPRLSRPAVVAIILGGVALAGGGVLLGIGARWQGGETERQVADTKNWDEPRPLSPFIELKPPAVANRNSEPLPPSSEMDAPPTGPPIDNAASGVPETILPGNWAFDAGKPAALAEPAMVPPSAEDPAAVAAIPGIPSTPFHSADGAEQSGRLEGAIAMPAALMPALAVSGAEPAMPALPESKPPQPPLVLPEMAGLPAPGPLPAPVVPPILLLTPDQSRLNGTTISFGLLPADSGAPPPSNSPDGRTVPFLPEPATSGAAPELPADPPAPVPAVPSAAESLVVRTSLPSIGPENASSVSAEAPAAEAASDAVQAAKPDEKRGPTRAHPAQMSVTGAESSPSTPNAAPMLEPSKPSGPATERVADIAAPAPAVARTINGVAPTQPPALPALSATTLGVLLRRGDEAFRNGDVSAARLLYGRAAAHGSGQAALSLGRTYDPSTLLTIGAHGLKADRAAALGWYRQALSLGIGEAQAMIQQLEAKPIE